MLTSALSKAVEKAMESDVEYRRGLPVNLCSFMGSGLVSTYFICFVFANGLLYKNRDQTILPFFSMDQECGILCSCTFVTT